MTDIEYRDPDGRLMPAEPAPAPANRLGKAVNHLRQRAVPAAMAATLAAASLAMASNEAAASPNHGDAGVVRTEDDEPNQ